MTASGDSHDIVGLTRDFCQYRTAVVAEDNEAMFARLAQEVPLQLHRYPSGSVYNGWIVPDLWTVQRALIRRDGVVVFDGQCHPLAVAYYSRSFQGRVRLEELKEHISTNPEYPTAYLFHCLWQYRPWAPDWAFCIPHEIVRTWQPGEYEVDLVTDCRPGEMLVASARHQGRTDQTIVFNAHTCHPHMANDGFVGVATLVRLFQWLAGQETNYSYEVVFGPEHLGTVYYLRDRTRKEIERLVCGVFAEMTGHPGPYKVAATFRGDQPIDRAFRNAARHHAREHALVDWRMGAGNDETVWEAPGYEVPFIQVTRSRHYLTHFPGYHTSLDTPDRLCPDLVNEFFTVTRKAIEVLEQNAVMYRKFDGLISLANPQYQLYMERPDPAMNKNLEADSEKWGRLLDFLFRYFDGATSILDIAEKHDLPFDRLYRYLKRFEEKGLIRMEFQSIRRPPLTLRECA